jgi:DNA-cytosine methyltransferase
VKALDLFCGAGGASIGLHAAGLIVHGYDKWDDALATHNKNGLWAGELDLSQQTAESWRQHIALTGFDYDMIWASPPCQGWSQGGKQKGMHDERNGFPWTLEAIEGVHPRLVITENVRGLTFAKNLPYLEHLVIEPLRTLGYTVEWRLLNCADYGVPQRRMRLFIVARLDGAPCWPTQTHSDPKAKGGLKDGTVPWVTMASALGWGRTDAPSGTVVGGSSRSGGTAPLDGGAHSRKQIRAAREDGRWLEHPDTTRPSASVDVSVEDAAALQAFPSGEYMVGFPRRADGLGETVEIDGVEYRARDLTPGDEPARTVTEKARSWKVFLNTGGDWKKGGGRADAQMKDPYEDPAPTVRGVPFQSRWQFEDGSTEQVSEHQQAVLQSFPVELPELPAWAHEEPAPTLSTTFGSVGGKKLGGHRNLTLPEAQILQAFPHGYEFCGTRTSQYLQIGNAVPPPMAYLLAVANRP